MRYIKINRYLCADKTLNNLHCSTLVHNHYRQCGNMYKIIRDN
jgi:hypothetical protein